MAEKLIPSLDAVAQLSVAEQQRLELPRVRPFRHLKVLDSDKLAQACHQETLDRLKAKLASGDPENAEAYRACTSADALYAVAPWYQAQLTELIRGRFVRVEDMSANHCDARLYWADDAFGDGHVHLSYNEDDGKIHADTEGMGRQMLRSFLLRLADEIVIDN